MRKVFLVFCLALSLSVLGQTDEKPAAVKSAEFETVTNGYVKMMMDSFFVELNNDPNAQGFIINYGTERELAMREEQIRNAIKFRLYDSSRLTLVRGGFRVPVRTEFWRVPAGAENPVPEEGFKLYDEFGKIPRGEFKARFDSLFIGLQNNPDATGYVVNYGPTKQVTALEKMIKNFIIFRGMKAERFVLIKGGYRKELKTEIWIDNSKK